jgi:hypothetical protein
VDGEDKQLGTWEALSTSASGYLALALAHEPAHLDDNRMEELVVLPWR